MRIDRKRKQSVTTLLQALGMSHSDILEEFGEFESIRSTLEKDRITSQDEALIDIYRKQRPGEPPTRDAGEAMLNNLYFNPKRYDLAKVGRYKIGKKLGLEGSLSESTLRLEDVVATIKYIVALHDGVTEYTSSAGREVRVETDDIDLSLIHI